MQQPTKTMEKEEWQDEFNKAFPHKMAEVIDDWGSSVKSDLKSFISTQISLAKSQERQRIVEEIEEVVENIEIEKAHTYSSENADVYRAYDAGQEYTQKKILLAIKQITTK